MGQQISQDNVILLGIGRSSKDPSHDSVHASRDKYKVRGVSSWGISLDERTGEGWKGLMYSTVRPDVDIREGLQPKEHRRGKGPAVS